MSGVELIAFAVACCSLFAASWAARATFPLRARIDKLEEERPRFLAELEGLSDECRETLDRADAKRKRAENVARSSAQQAAQQGPLLMSIRRGSVIE